MDDKYTIYNLPEYDGISYKSPISKMLIDLSHDETIDDATRSRIAIKVAIELNMKANDLEYRANEIEGKYNDLCSLLLSDKEQSILKLKRWIFDNK